MPLRPVAVLNVEVRTRKTLVCIAEQNGKGSWLENGGRGGCKEE
jgi:hypothetical protein